MINPYNKNSVYALNLVHGPFLTKYSAPVVVLSVLLTSRSDSSPSMIMMMDGNICMCNNLPPKVIVILFPERGSNLKQPYSKWRKFTIYVIMILTPIILANRNLRNPCEIEEFFEKCEIIWKLRNNLKNAKHLNKLNLVFKSAKCEIFWKLRNYLENAKH